MTSRERIRKTINHEEPDRVPIVIGASNATGLKIRPYRELKTLLGVDAPDRYIYDWPELGTALPDEAVHGPQDVAADPRHVAGLRTQPHRAGFHLADIEHRTDHRLHRVERLEAVLDGRARAPAIAQPGCERNLHRDCSGFSRNLPVTFRSP